MPFTPRTIRKSPVLRSDKPYLRNAGYLPVLCLSVALLAGSCDRTSKDPLGEIRQRGRLVVLIRNTPTIYYEGPVNRKGFEYDLVSAFAAHIGVELELKIYDSVPDLLEAIERGEGDLASGAITRTPEREEQHLFGPDYYTVQQQVVYRRGEPSPESIVDLPAYRLMIGAGSSYEERLRELSVSYPSLTWETSDSLSTEQLISDVWNGRIDCTVADQNIVAINRRYYPGLRVAFPISEQQRLAWVMNPTMERLIPIMQEWFDEFERSGRLARLREKYYGMVEIYDYVDIRQYHKRIETRLPEYRAWFEEAGELYGIPWTLLAAQAYQESHWNPAARSPTGVRGIMMLTLVTAETVGVGNRMDARQSIMGGARYLARLLRRVPDDIVPDDRLSYALAAYNVGMGHMNDARTLALRLGRNPSRWSDLQDVLPLLANKQYYRDLPHGYARGSEPVRYVRRISNYRNILENTVE